MKIKSGYIKGAFAEIMISIISIVILTAGLAYLILTGQIGEGSAGLWMNMTVAIGVAIGGLLSSRFIEPAVICNLMSTGILTIMMLICGLLTGAKIINIASGIGAIIAGFVPVYIISRKKGRKKKRQNRQYR